MTYQRPPASADTIGRSGRVRAPTVAQDAAPAPSGGPGDPPPPLRTRNRPCGPSGGSEGRCGSWGCVWMAQKGVATASPSATSASTAAAWSSAPARSPREFEQDHAVGDDLGAVPLLPLAWSSQERVCRRPVFGQDAPPGDPRCYGYDGVQKVEAMQSVTCFKCGAEIGPGALYWLRDGREVHPYCEPCALAIRPIYRLPWYTPKFTVCRHCGRRLYYLGAAVWPSWYCTEGCRRAARRERRWAPEGDLRGAVRAMRAVVHRHARRRPLLLPRLPAEGVSANATEQRRAARMQLSVGWG